jgi:hypothetical protein
MKVDDTKPFRECIAAMCVGFGQEATEATYMAYWMGLSDMALESVQRAVAMAMRNCRMIPRPIELRELVEGKQQDRVEIAWMEVQKAIPLGPYKHVDFGDGVINATVRSLGGWPNFLARFSSAEEEKWARNDFVKTYQRLINCGLSDEAMAYLPGMTEMQAVPYRIASSQPTGHARLQHTPARAVQRIGEPI